MEAFIFDMDGVIVESELLHARIKMETFRHFGIPFDEERLNRYMGRASKELFAEVLQEQGKKELSAQEMAVYKHQRYLEVLEQGDSLPQVPGTLQLIQCLKNAGARIALATSSQPKAAEFVLHQFGLETAFESVLTCADVTETKPNPEIYLLVAERLGVSPVDCVVLEDSQNGVAAAKAAGMTCIGYRNPYSGKQDLGQADFVVDAISDIDIAEFGWQKK